MEILIPPSIERSKSLSDLHALQVNLGVQDANEPLNNMFKIVQYQNSHVFEVRL